jgi:hypothetical protein
MKGYGKSYKSHGGPGMRQKHKELSMPLGAFEPVLTYGRGKTSVTLDH